jgi:sulfur carrier protein
VSAAVPDSAPGSTPSLSVNGQARPLGDGTLTGLLEAEAVDTQSVNPQSVNLGARGLAVAVNGQVVPRHAWDATRLAPGDEVEIVKLFAGG